MSHSAADRSAETSPSQPSIKSPLSGWAGIEDNLVRHDSSMVRDYADDIDTLLVFAGLFSAVLTAFVVETYSLLQPDSAGITNQLLKLGLSAQFGSPALDTSSVNDAVAAIIGSSNFTPTVPARWINSLFFVSLVMTLAAALLGILAKQWLREYMQWNLALGDPRQNVLVRQIRFEAWEAWNVAATIACIPALLELAVILFLGGVVVLLWTLDDAVAIAVTAITAIFLGIVTTFTVLPIFLKRCPYKSPTAWACAISFSFIRDLLQAPLWAARRFRFLMSSDPRILSSQTSWDKVKRAVPAFIRSLRERQFSARIQTWRVWDLDSCRDPVNTSPLIFSLGHKSSLGLRAAAERQIMLEAHHFDAQGALLDHPVPHWLKDRAPALFTDIGETSYLLRALSWVKTASQSPNIDSYIDECVMSIHPPFDAKDEPLSAHLYQVQALSTWCLALSTRRAFRSSYGPLLCNPSIAVGHEGPFHATRDPTISELRRALQIQRTRDASGTDSIRPMHQHDPFFMARWSPMIVPLHDSQTTGGESEWNTVLILLRTVVATVQRLHLDLTSQRDNSGLTPEGSPDVDVRRVFELFMLALGISQYRNTTGSRSMVETPWYLELITCVFLNDNCRKQRREGPVAPGLRLNAFIHACGYARVICLPAIDDTGPNLVFAHGSMSTHDYTSLLSDYFPASFDQCDYDDLEMFTFAAFRWLELLEQTYADVPTSDLLQKIASAITAAAHRNRSHSEEVPRPRYNTYVHWIRHLETWQEDAPAQLTAHCGAGLRSLLHAYEGAWRTHVLPPRLRAFDDLRIPLHLLHLDTGKCLHHALVLAHRSLDACEEAGCRWVAHTCDDWAACPLLHIDVDAFPPRFEPPGHDDAPP